MLLQEPETKATAFADCSCNLTQINGDNNNSMNI